MIGMKPKRHIVWFHDRDIDLSNPGEALRYYEQVLTHGRAEDIRQLDLDAVLVKRRLLELSGIILHDLV